MDRIGLQLSCEHPDWLGLSLQIWDPSPTLSSVGLGSCTYRYATVVSCWFETTTMTFNCLFAQVAVLCRWLIDMMTMMRQKRRGARTPPPNLERWRSNTHQMFGGRWFGYVGTTKLQGSAATDREAMTDGRRLVPDERDNFPALAGALFPQSSPPPSR